MTFYIGDSIVSTGMRTYRVTGASHSKVSLVAWSIPRCSVCGRFSGKKHTKFCERHAKEDNKKRAFERYYKNKK